MKKISAVVPGEIGATAAAHTGKTQAAVYRLVAASTATAAVHDGENHDGHQSSQRGANPKSSARELHSTPPMEAWTA